MAIERKFKQTAMVNISRSSNKNNNVSLQIIEHIKKTMSYDV